MSQVNPNWVNVTEASRVYNFEDYRLEFRNVSRIEFLPHGHRIEAEVGIDVDDDGKTVWAARKVFVNQGWLWVEIDSESWAS